MSPAGDYSLSPTGDKELAMNRRQFIRIAGGGGAVIAASTIAGCSDALPQEATAAWKSAGREADVRRWILSYAILAPHSHNLQSWLVDLHTPDEIVLRCDRERLLPQTDPLSRQIMMSHGTFLELLDIAARQRGFRSEITLFPEGAYPPDKIDERPVASVRLVADTAVRKDPLFPEIVKRRTNRNAYDLARPVPAAAWQAMANAVQPYPLTLGYVDAGDPDALRRHRAIAAEAWRIELVTPRTILESYRWLRVGSSEVARHRDGLSLMDPTVVWLNRLGLFDRSKAPGPDDFATTSQISAFNRKLDATPAFLWMITADNDRKTQVDAGRTYARVQLAATAHGVVMHPLQQALQEYVEQAKPYGEIRQLLKVAPSQTVQMWTRVGFAPPVEPAPRRGLAAHLA
jgi:hypothetical protein